MELLFLRAYANGYRGCGVDDHDYFFFQCNRKGRVRRLKSYPKDDFVDRRHFTLMMQKFVSPPIFLQPPMALSSLTIEALDGAYARIVASKQ
jgi:hypothetical protein